MITVAKKYEELTVSELYEIIKLRVNVFVVEQDCPYPDLDDKDQKAVHIYLIDNNELVAYLRVFEKGYCYTEACIGRVVSKYHLRGYGRKIMEAGIRYIQEHELDDQVRIMAQCQAIPFYERFGFQVCSEEFLEDGIPHKEMLLRL